MKWFIRNKKPAAVTDEWADLLQSIEQARKDWHYAQHHVSLSEGKEAIDRAIYHLRLTEKRYMFLLDCARRYHQMCRQA
ncbi:YaaL family protein [Brevibacillus humidisoli]|uniref:YaaL family protein n=1 Tax=Brevibacillus humidisoli TaxID=2895522 RepID=UPI001E2CB370|nr:YaaL family protein [Brevibacillus humidisoli]UFJ40510.1 YaaL family protein [Brevibacillus humidisoli]